MKKKSKNKRKTLKIENCEISQDFYAEPRGVGLVAPFSDVLMLFVPLALEILDIISTSPLLLHSPSCSCDSQ